MKRIAAMFVIVTSCFFTGVATQKHFQLFEPETVNASEKVFNKNSNLVGSENTHVSIANTLTEQDIRNLFRQEIKSAFEVWSQRTSSKVADVVPNNTDGQSGKASIATTDERQLAARNSDPKKTQRYIELLDNAIDTNVWSEQDNDEFRALFINVDPAMQQEYMRKFAQAVNEGRIDVTFDGPLF